MLLLLDNYDSFTYNLKDYFEQLGQACFVVRNDEVTVEELKKLPITRIVISPGPKRPQDAGILNKVIENYYQTLPILGICLGHQAIGSFFGAQLVKSAYPMHGKISEVHHTGDALFASIPQQFKVCRYHSLELQWQQNKHIKSIATTANGTIMAIKHNTYPVWGVQFHPEAILTEYGMVLLKNWITL
jgi:anthranilate synthase/aminodeoxychorismate synthase-like glutamine amidotransferase